MSVLHSHEKSGGRGVGRKAKYPGKSGKNPIQVFVQQKQKQVFSSLVPELNR